MIAMTTDKTADEYLTYKEAAQRFDISAATLQTWALRRELRKYRRGDGRVVLKADDVARAIARRREIRPIEE